jgi:hypothetical protein
MVVVSGTLTAGEKAGLLACLDEGEYFIPGQVGLMELQSNLAGYSGGKMTEDDHVWHELQEDDILDTEERPTIDMTAADLLKAFKRAGGAWDVRAAMGRLDLPE